VRFAQVKRAPVWGADGCILQDSAIFWSAVAAFLLLALSVTSSDLQKLNAEDLFAAIAHF
jgi:hypothetical protein